MEQRPRGRPRSEPVEVQRRRILDAARSAFSTVGYDAATVAQIATEANVARPVVYEAVGDKEALLLAVAEEMSEELVAAFDERVGGPEQVEQPVSEVVRDDLAWFVAWIRAHPSFVSITRLSSALAAHGPDPAAHARRHIEDRLTELHVRRAERFGVLRGESARIISMLVISMAEAVAYRIGVEDDWPADATAAIAIEFATGGYLQIEGHGREAADRFDGLVSRSSSDAEQGVDAQGDAFGQ
jgi:AcrR family transcriptional regulator